jgi:hypothetical protein
MNKKDLKKWKNQGAAATCVGSFLILISWFASEPEIRVLLIASGIGAFTFGLIFFSRLWRVDKIILHLEPNPGAGPHSDTVISIPEIHFESRKQREEPLYERARGREIVVGEAELSVFYPLVVSSATAKIKNELIEKSEPYFKIQIGSILEFRALQPSTDDFGGSREVYVLTCPDGTFSRSERVDREVFSKYVTSADLIALGPLPSEIIIARWYLKGQEARLLEALRPLLKVPILIEKEIL